MYHPPGACADPQSVTTPLATGPEMAHNKRVKGGDPHSNSKTQMANNNRRNKAIGAVRNTDTNLGGWSAGTTGAQMTMTPQRGLGAKMVNNLEGVVKNAKRQYAEDRKAAARERAAEREVEALASIDSLLDDIRG